MTTNNINYYDSYEYLSKYSKYFAKIVSLPKNDSKRHIKRILAEKKIDLLIGKILKRTNYILKTDTLRSRLYNKIATFNFILSKLQKDPYFYSDLKKVPAGTASIMIRKGVSLCNIDKKLRNIRWVVCDIHNINFKPSNKWEFYTQLNHNIRSIELVKKSHQLAIMLRKKLKVRQLKIAYFSETFVDYDSSIINNKWVLRQYISLRDLMFNMDCEYNAFNDLCDLIFGRRFQKKEIIAGLIPYYINYDRLNSLKRNFRHFKEVLNFIQNTNKNIDNHTIVGLANYVCWNEKPFKGDLHILNNIWSDRLPFGHGRPKELLTKFRSKFNERVSFKLISSGIINPDQSAKEMYGEDSDLSKECLRHLCPKEAFIYAKSILSKKDESVDIRMKGKSLKYKDRLIYVLDKNDVRGLFLGEYTNCCQKIGGIGSECAVFGVQKSSSGFVVVENSKILCQSWWWIRDNNLVFDNVEGNCDYISKKMYIDFANSIDGFKSIRVGGGSSDMDLDGLDVCKDIIEPPEFIYSDAKGEQYYLTKKHE